MKTYAYVFDPTQKDKLSKVRGIGRYLEILRENFNNEFVFTGNLESIPLDSVFINPFFNFLLKPILFKKKFKYQIAVIHDLIPLKYPRYFPIGIKGNINVMLNKLALKNYDLIITDSAHSKKDIITMLNIQENKVKIIYPILSKLFTNKEYENSMPENIDIDNFFLYVGDATWNKNLCNLAKAIKRANVTCVFAGKVFTDSLNKDLNHPWQKELKEFLKLAENDSRFIFPGYVSNNKLISYYKKAKANILVSKDEGFGLSYIEASSQNCASLVSDISIFHEITQSAAFFANPDSYEDIAEKLTLINSNTALINNIKEKAKQRIIFFSQEKFKTEYLKAINK